jgi:hypothetical protein
MKTFNYEMETFEHVTFKCDLDLDGSNPIIVLCTSSYNGDHLSCLCQVTLKIFSGFKVMERTRKCYGRTDRQTEAIPIFPFRYSTHFRDSHFCLIL